MNIGNPSSLFLFLLIPLIILLHILVRRMETHNVSSLLIWEKVQRNRSYKFPSILLLLLQILTLGFLILSLAGITIPYTLSLRKNATVLLIDNSASMSVIENGQSRLEDAKEKAINIVKNSSGEIMVLTAANPPEIITSYSKDRSEVIKSIRSINETDLSNGIEETMKMASASVTSSGSIIMISDGAFDFIPWETANFKFIKAGRESSYNLGITDFYLRKTPRSDSFELYISLTNFSREDMDYVLNIYKNAILHETVKGSILKDEVKKMLFQIDSEPETELLGELLVNDLLKSDNRASAYISLNEKKRILLLTPGNFFLENALNAIPGLSIEIEKSPDMSVYNNTDDYDVLIFDRIPPPQQDDSGRFIFIDVLPSGIRREHDKIKPFLISIIRKHPVLESVDFSSVTILNAWPPLAGPQLEEIVTGGNTGLLYLLDTKYLKFVYFPFNLTDSDLPLHVSFPILIANSINWLTDGFKREEIIQYKTGDSFFIGKADPRFGESEVFFPETGKTTIKDNYFTKTFYTGLYRFEYAGDRYFASVNLTDSDESNIFPRFSQVREEEREERMGEYIFPVFSALLFAAFFLMTAEWIVQEDKW